MFLTSLPKHGGRVSLDFGNEKTPASDRWRLSMNFVVTLSADCRV